MSSKKLSRAEWSEFWKNDTLTTFLGTFGRNYDGEIKAYWDSTFSKLANNAKIIDLATGNGALALLAMEYSKIHAKNFSVTAIDFSEINPDMIPSLNSNEKKLIQSIDFFSNNNIEKTDFTDNSFDCAISQYGIEYSNLEKTIPELNRILKPNAILSVIVHNIDSKIIKHSSESLQQIEFFLNKSILETILKEIINKFSQVNNQIEFEELVKSEKLQKLRGDYNLAIRDIASKTEHYENKWVTDFILSSFSNILGLAPNFPLNEKFKKIEAVHKELSLYTKRTEDLLTAALNVNQLTQFENLLLKNQFSDIKIAPQYYKNNDLIGYTVSASYN